MEFTSILQRAANGERVAQEELFARVAERLEVYVEHRLGRALARRVEVQDVVQETLLRTWGALGRAELNGEGPFLAMVCRIARNVIADIARAARRQRRGGGAAVLSLARSDWSTAGAASPPDSSAGPYTRAALGEARGRMRQAWRALSPEHRRVLALRQFEGLSARETAQRIGSTEQAVHAMFRRALSRWGEELERLGGAPSG